MWTYDFPFCCEFGKMLQIHVFRGVRPDYYSITSGRLSQPITILHGRGSLGTPNLYYVIYGRPQIKSESGFSFAMASQPLWFCTSFRRERSTSVRSKIEQETITATMTCCYTYIFMYTSLQFYICWKI